MNIPAGFRDVESTVPYGVLTGPYYYWFDDIGGDAWLLGFRVEKRHCSRIGLCHGGTIMGFMDVVSGQASREENIFPIVTMELNAKLLRPIKKGDWVTGTGRITSIGGKNKDEIYIECEIYARDKLVGTATSKWKKIRHRTIK
jgi:uncharacterized protein (TIGR00369 family)